MAFKKPLDAAPLFAFNTRMQQTGETAVPFEIIDGKIVINRE